MNEEQINTNNNDNKSEKNKLKNEVIIHGDDYIEQNNNVIINDESRRYVVQDLKGGKKRYYIINELFSFDYMKIFFGAEIKNNSISKDSDCYIIRFSKKYILETIFDITDQTRFKAYEKIFESFSEIVDNYTIDQIEGVERINDFILDKNYIYFILSLQSQNLYDFVYELRDRLFNEGMEIRIRNIFKQILEITYNVHEKKLHLLGLLDLKNIFLFLNEENKFKDPQLLIIHPILADLITLLKFYSKKNNYEEKVFFPPEIVKHLNDKKKILISIKNKKSFNILYDYFESENINDCSYDYWIIGYQIYYMIYGFYPEKFDFNLEECSYNIPDCSIITDDTLSLIIGFLKFNLKERFNMNNEGKEIIENFIMNSDNINEIKKKIDEKKNNIEKKQICYYLKRDKNIEKENSENLNENSENLNEKENSENLNENSKNLNEKENSENLNENSKNLNENNENLNENKNSENSNENNENLNENENNENSNDNNLNNDEDKKNNEQEDIDVNSNFESIKNMNSHNNSISKKSNNNKSEKN